MNAERRLADIARIIGDPTRAAMLWSLMGGEARPAGELALIGNVSSQTASNHLAQLRDAKLVTLQVRGRNHFYQLRDTSVAKALESLMHLACPEPTRKADGVAARVAPELMLARTCYDHLAGMVAVQITKSMQDRRWINVDHNDFQLTASGKGHLTSIGIDLQVANGSRRRFAYPCLDWSERVAHIGGVLGAALLNWLIEKKAVVRIRDSRAMRITNAGREMLEQHFGLVMNVGGGSEVSSRAIR
jgi:DNA-binding transcriptional ArsR family regulator